MRTSRVNLPNRCSHLISRVAHRAFFLDAEERTRLVDIIRRVSRFSGVNLLAYSVMSSHFHVFVHIGYPEKLDDVSIRQMLKEREWKDAEDLKLVLASKRPERRGKCYAASLETPGYVPQVIEKGDNVLALRLLQLLQWDPKPPAYLRTTLGISSREYFTKAYLRPLTEAGLIARSDPDHPNSPL